LEYACNMANASKYINSLPLKYDTMLGEKGVRLSGGQRQRLSLARAVVRNPEILILDEATSSLDSESEQKIQVAINNIVHRTTVIVIAHRLSTITNSDYIYVLDQGEIKEEGTFDRLIQQNGLFTQMIKLQKMDN
jgi:ABC-type multidrug transport system fused ATPase/permease subunit